MHSNGIRSVGLWVLVIAVFLLSSCGSKATVEPTATLPPPTDTSLPPSETPVPPTATPVPTDTPSPTPTTFDTETPTVTPIQATVPPDRAILVYFIGKEAAPALPPHKQTQQAKKQNQSCGSDVLLSVNTGMPRTGNTQVDVATALNRLFSYHQQYVAGLYNPVYTSTFAVTSVELKGTTAYIYLSGSYVKSNDKCDKGRVRNQVWQTVRQFKDIKVVQIYLGSALLGDVLAVQG